MSSRTPMREEGIARSGCRGGPADVKRDVRLAALIPARYAAQRLPGKPLADIAGVPMVVRVAQRASQAEGIAQAARDLKADGYLNVQGDEPLIDPRAIAQVAGLVRDGARMATLARPLQSGEESLPQVVKVVLDSRRRALYFSRSMIPYPRGAGELTPLAHVGLYGFAADTLQDLERVRQLIAGDQRRHG